MQFNQIKEPKTCLWADPPCLCLTLRSAGRALSANRAMPSCSCQSWGSRVSTLTHVPGLLDTDRDRKGFPLFALKRMRVYGAWLLIHQKQQCLTKLLHLLALDLQLLDELADLALLGQTLAVLHVTHVDVQPTCNKQRTAEELWVRRLQCFCFTLKLLLILTCVEVLQDGSERGRVYLVTHKMMAEKIRWPKRMLYGHAYVIGT